MSSSVPRTKSTSYAHKNILSLVCKYHETQFATTESAKTASAAALPVFEVEEDSATLGCLL